MAASDKNHFSEVMATLMYDKDRVAAMKSSPLLVSLDRAMKETQGQPDEVLPSAELLRELKGNVRFLNYSQTQSKPSKSGDEGQS